VDQGRHQGRAHALRRQQPRQGVRHIRGGGQARAEDQADHPPAVAGVAAVAAVPVKPGSRLSAEVSTALQIGFKI
jgi:hypothetical protein